MANVSSMREASAAETTNYGGFVDAIGGIATVVLAIIALSGTQEGTITAIATIVFGAALLIQGGTMLTEFSRMMFPAGIAAPGVEQFSGGTLATLFLSGIGGIVLGVLALLGIYPAVLTAAALIAFGGALVLSSNAVWQLHVVRRSTMGGGMYSAAEILASEMASGSAVFQALAGVAAIVLGILAVVGIHAPVLTLIGLLVIGATVVMTGGSLSGAAVSFMHPASPASSPMTRTP
ncbi:MAG TPA: hypothetical protein VFL51_11215 [Pseudolabrys sp.]|nr:hypothetical protein [Pseudolabrys sp.]